MPKFPNFGVAFWPTRIIADGPRYCRGKQSPGRRNYAVRASTPAISPAINRSSSSSGQCKEMPPPPISYFARSLGVAWNSNGNQISGTAKSRPSMKVTRNISSSHSADFAKAEVGTNAGRNRLGSVEVLIPGV